MPKPTANRNSTPCWRRRAASTPNAAPCRLNQLQDESIPILNQMAYDVTLGLDNVWGLASSALGLSGKAIRFGKALGIITEVGDTTVDAATRTSRACGAMHAAQALALHR